MCLGEPSSMMALWHRWVSVVVAAQFLLDLLDFLGKGLVEDASAFTPGLAFRLGLCGVGGDFTTVYFLVTFSLALEFRAQFFFRHINT